MTRVKKMCKAALLLLAVNYVADSTVLQVVKEQLRGNVLEEGDELESAFVD